MTTNILKLFLFDLENINFSSIGNYVGTLKLAHSTNNVITSTHRKSCYALSNVQAGKSLYRGKVTIPHVQSSTNYGLGCLPISNTPTAYFTVG